MAGCAALGVAAGVTSERCVRSSTQCQEGSAMAPWIQLAAAGGAMLVGGAVIATATKAPSVETEGLEVGEEPKTPQAAASAPSSSSSSSSGVCPVTGDKAPAVSCSAGTQQSRGSVLDANMTRPRVVWCAGGQLLVSLQKRDE